MIKSIAQDSPSRRGFGEINESFHDQEEQAQIAEDINFHTDQDASAKTRFIKEDMIKASDQAYMQWFEISYHVPYKVESNAMNTKIAAQDQEKGLPPLTIKTFMGSSKHFKQIVHNSSGYVAPHEMVAIMGPSGSGKTSLLNVISQRTFLMPGGRSDGKVTINNQAIGKGDYSKLGAYVQQDDVLVDVLTPRELLMFACRMRTQYDRETIDKVVNKIIKRLGLVACADQQIGGWLKRGISGGERKRTSIGYELITEPSLLLLDEPTSGLDASTALRIVEVLRKQAERGMAVMATIHQPAADIFFKFDRVILLSEGYTIYNGPPGRVKDYFEQFGLTMGRFSNPADKLSNIASEPRRTLNAITSILQLSEACIEQLYMYRYMPASMQTAVDTFTMRGGVLQARNNQKMRGVSSLKQYSLLLKRMFQQAVRVPIAFAALIMMAFFQGIFQASIFYNVGSGQYVPGDTRNNVQLSTNLMGLAFLVGSDQFITCSFAQVLQIPVARPIFIREVSNRMYGTTPYYLAMATSTVLMFILYPIVVTITSFFFFDFDVSDFGAMLYWMWILMLTAVCGGFWGFSFGTFMENEVAATQLNMLFLIMYSFGAGFYANTGSGMNVLVRLISYISPLRYSTELLLQRVMEGKPGGQMVLDAFGFTWGDGACMSLLLIWTLTCFFVGWISLLWKTRDF